MKVIKDYVHYLISSIINKKIIAEDNDHLKKLIKINIKVKGNKCNLNHIDVSNITNMNKLFSNSTFNGDISKWNTGKVESMLEMFKGSKFTGDISKWDVSNVTDMMGIFSHSQFNNDISNWDVSNVENMTFTFAYSSFNNDISKWNVSKVSDMHCMFANSPFNQDISQWDVSNVKTMRYMFRSSPFSFDLTNWQPYNTKDKLGPIIDMFEQSNSVIPYWAKYNELDERATAIKQYIALQRYNELNESLDKVGTHKKRIKL